MSRSSLTEELRWMCTAKEINMSRSLLALNYFDVFISIYQSEANIAWEMVNRKPLLEKQNKN